MRVSVSSWMPLRPWFSAARRLPHGRGLILGTLIGAVLLGILNNGLNLMGINPYLQDVIKGGIILLAIYIGRDWR